MVGEVSAKGQGEVAAKGQGEDFWRQEGGYVSGYCLRGYYQDRRQEARNAKIRQENEDRSGKYFSLGEEWHGRHDRRHDGGGDEEWQGRHDRRHNGSGDENMVDG